MLQFSPVKLTNLVPLIPSTPTRKKQPSPEKKCLPSTTVLFKNRTSTVTDCGSPIIRAKGLQDHSQVDSHFEIQLALRESSPDLARVVAASKRIELPYQLVDDDGNAVGPPEGDWSEVAGIFKRAFPTLHAVELSAPYLIVRFAELPSSPWPFTIGGLPLRFTDSEHGGHFNPGVLGRGKNELQTIDLRGGDKLSDRKSTRLNSSH